jgi:predicted N-acyltransferase
VLLPGDRILHQRGIAPSKAARRARQAGAGTAARLHSLHAIGDPAFADAIAAYCARERVDVAHAVDELEESTPFRDPDK